MNPENRVQGPATTPRQFRTITVVVSQMPDGSLGIKAAGAPGWAAIVRTHEQLARAMHAAFIETQVAAYSRWKGERYDQDVSSEEPQIIAATHNGLRYRRYKKRMDVYSLEDWTKLADGNWLSPQGRLYRANTQMAKRIVANRLKNGMSA